MMDREKVIKEYEEFVDKYECFSSSDDYVLEMHKAVLALLKEQEAKTVESIQISRNFYAELTGYCPSCNRPLKEKFNKRFCGSCGRAVKWD